MLGRQSSWKASVSRTNDNRRRTYGVQRCGGIPHLHVKSEHIGKHNIFAIAGGSCIDVKMIVRVERTAELELASAGQQRAESRW